MRRYEFFLLALVAMLFVFPRRAEAYLDPVTGSIIWQVAIGGLLAVTATIRIYWGKIRSFFSRKTPSGDPPKA